MFSFNYNTEPCVSAICETAKIVEMFCKRRWQKKIYHFAANFYGKCAGLLQKSFGKYAK